MIIRLDILKAYRPTRIPKTTHFQELEPEQDRQTHTDATEHITTSQSWVVRMWLRALGPTHHSMTGG